MRGRRAAALGVIAGGLLPLLGSIASLGAAASLPACSSNDAPATGVGDGGEDAGFGVTTRDAATDAMGDAAYERVTPHQGKVVPEMKLRIVYLGVEGVDGAPNVDDFVGWLVQSSWWDILAQYGVKRGTLLPSVRIDTASFFSPGMVSSGLVKTADLDQRLAAILHPELDGGVDGGADAGDAAIDGALDASGDPDASGTPPPSPDAGITIGPADAYLVMLPNGVNVDLGTQGSHTFQTCIDAGGYHAFDGHEPYAVMPPCRLGRSALAISHELAETATNPVPGAGWFSEAGADQRAGGGEVADICNFPVSKGVDGWLVSQVWSNAAGACVP